MAYLSVSTLWMAPNAFKFLTCFFFLFNNVLFYYMLFINLLVQGIDFDEHLW